MITDKETITTAHRNNSRNFSWLQNRAQLWLTSELIKQAYLFPPINLLFIHKRSFNHWRFPISKNFSNSKMVSYSLPGVLPLESSIPLHPSSCLWYFSYSRHLEGLMLGLCCWFDPVTVSHSTYTYILLGYFLVWCKSIYDG